MKNNKLNQMNKKNFPFEAYQCKDAIAQSIIPLLEEYRGLILSGDSYGLPSWVAHEGELLSQEEMEKRWIDYLDKIINAFRLELSGHLQMTEKEEKEQQEGLDLFAKYYCHLWD